MYRRSFLRGAAAGTVAVAAPRLARAGGREKLTVLVASSPPGPASHFFFYPRELGFYREQGLDVDVKTIVSDVNTARAVVAGEVDIGWVGALAALQAYNAGSHLRCISSFAPTLDYQIATVRGIDNPRALEGRTFSVATIGGLSQLIPALIVKKHGGDPRLVKWVGGSGIATRTQALVAKAVDAALIDTSMVVRVNHYDYLHVLAAAGIELPHFLYAWEVVNPASLERKLPAYRAFVAAVAKGTRWAMAHPDDAVKLSQSILPNATKEEISFAIKSYATRHFWSADGRVPRDTWDFTTATLQQGGFIKSFPKFDEFIVAGLSDATGARVSSQP